MMTGEQRPRTPPRVAAAEFPRRVSLASSDDSHGELQPRSELPEVGGEIQSRSEWIEASLGRHAAMTPQAVAGGVAVAAESGLQYRPARVAAYSAMAPRTRASEQVGGR